MQYFTFNLLTLCFLGAAVCLNTGVKGHGEEEREDNIIETPPKSIILESTLSRHKREVVPADVTKEDAVEVVGETKILCEISMGNNLCTRLATGCYCVINTQLSWSQAYHYCRNNGIGASLLSIDSLPKQLDLQINLPRLVGQSNIISKVGLWTSGSFFPTLGIFLWTSSLQPFFISQYWMPGYPNNEGLNDCVRIIPSANAAWADLDCNQYLPFICESPVI